MEAGKLPQAAHRGMVQAVIFDLDGLLMDSEWIGFRLSQELAEQHGGRLDEALFPLMVGTTMEETIALVMQHTGIRLNVPTSVAWMWKSFTERVRESAEPLPGALPLLQELYLRGYPLALASNSTRDYIENALEGLRLGGFFPVQVSIEQVQQGKPAPDLYLRAAEILHIPPGRCLALEDSRIGVQAAAAAGMRVLAIPGERDSTEAFPGAWRVYRSLVQVLDTLEEVLA